MSAEIIQRELFDENGELVGYKYVGRLVRCKGCLYYNPNISKCVHGSMIECKPDSYCSDAFGAEDYRRKINEVVNGLMDEVKE